MPKIFVLLFLVFFSFPGIAKGGCPEVIHSSHDSFTIWSTKVVDCALSEKSHLKTKDDVELWAKRLVVPLYVEFFMPEKIGRVVPGAYGTSSRNWRGEDLKKIKSSTKKLLTEARKHKSFPKVYLENLDMMLIRLEEMDTPQWRYNQELLERY